MTLILILDSDIEDIFKYLLNVVFIFSGKADMSLL